MKRRSFFKVIVGGLVAAAGPQIFVPKLIKPIWKPPPHTFGKWIYPVINNMPVTLEHLIAVQPMSEPRAAMFYLDLKQDLVQRRPLRECVLDIFARSNAFIKI